MKYQIRAQYKISETSVHSAHSLLRAMPPFTGNDGSAKVYLPMATQSVRIHNVRS